MLQEHVRKYSRSTQTVLLFALAVILSLNHVMMSVALLVLMVGGVSGLTTVNVCAQLKGLVKGQRIELVITLSRPVVVINVPGKQKKLF